MESGKRGLIAGAKLEAAGVRLEAKVKVLTAPVKILEGARANRPYGKGVESVEAYV